MYFWLDWLTEWKKTFEKRAKKGKQKVERTCTAFSLKVYPGFVSSWVPFFEISFIQSLARKIEYPFNISSEWEREFVFILFFFCIIGFLAMLSYWNKTWLYKDSEISTTATTSRDSDYYTKIKIDIKSQYYQHIIGLLQLSAQAAQQIMELLETDLDQLFNLDKNITCRTEKFSWELSAQAWYLLISHFIC